MAQMVTDAQRAAFEPYVGEWMGREFSGTTVTPDGRAEVVAGLRRCYEAAGLPWPDRVVWVPSPDVGRRSRWPRRRPRNGTAPPSSGAGPPPPGGPAGGSPLDAELRVALGSAADAELQTRVEVPVNEAAAPVWAAPAGRARPPGRFPAVAALGDGAAGASGGPGGGRGRRAVARVRVGCEPVARQHDGTVARLGGCAAMVRGWPV